MKKIVIDLDNTITIDIPCSYEQKPPNKNVISKLHSYKKKGFCICIYTARNMRTHESNIGKINIETLPEIIKWLDKNDVPYDEVIVGKPWCGEEGFYVDDKAIRPSEFSSLNIEEINEILLMESMSEDKKCF